MASRLVESFDRVVSANRNRVAVYGLSEDIGRTFAELRDDVASLQRAMLSLDLPDRPTIVSNIGNRTGFIALFIASLDFSAGLLLLDGQAPVPEILETAAAYGADMIVVPAGTSGFDAELRPLPCGLASLVRQRSEPSWRTPDEAGAFVLKVTSGSSGIAKAVVASEDNLFSDGRHVMEAMAIGPSDVNLATVPMAHSYGLGNLLLPLLLEGSPVVLRDRFVHAQWASDVATFGITTFPAVPYIYDYLRRSESAAAPLVKIRLAITAGAPMDFQTLEYFKNEFGIKIHSLYGTSETGSISFDGSEDLSDPVSVGWAVPGTTVTLVPAQGLRGGRVRVQGEAVCRRYARPEAGDAPSSLFTPEGFLTADLGRFEHDGRLTLVGRISDFINVAGRKVHPAEVERVIAEMADVVHVWVIGVTSGARGQELVACVQRRDANLSAAAVRTHCAAALSPHKVPRRVIFADELPVSSRGKISRRALEALLKTAEDRTDPL